MNNLGILTVLVFVVSMHEYIRHIKMFGKYNVDIDSKDLDPTIKQNFGSVIFFRRHFTIIFLVFLGLSLYFFGILEVRNYMIFCPLVLIMDLLLERFNDTNNQNN